MKNKTNNSKGIVYLCAAICFFMSAAIQGYVSVFGLLPDFFGVDIVKVSGAQSIYGTTMLFANLVAAFLFRKIGSKKCIIFSGLLMVLYGLGIAFVPNVSILYVAFVFSGIANSIGCLIASSDILVKKYGAEAGPLITVCVGGSILGCSFGQFIMGNLYENFGMEASFVFCSASALIVTIIAFFIKEEKVVVTEAEAEAQAVPKAASQSKSLIDLYKSPVFWLILLATFLGNAVLRPLLSYSSIYFPNYGLSISTTATVVSLLGLASGSFNMFLNGKVMQKLGVKVSSIIIWLCCAGMSVFAILFSKISAIWVIALIIVCYAVGATVSNLYSIVAPSIFGAEFSSEVITKAAAANGIGAIIFPIVLAKILNSNGIIATFVFVIIVCVICAVLYGILFAMAKKKTA